MQEKYVVIFIVVAITVDSKNIHLGYYKNFIDAVSARLEAEKKLCWGNCESTSPAYLYMQKVNFNKNI